jgi:hypothetical protein
VRERADLPRLPDDHDALPRGEPHASARAEVLLAERLARRGAEREQLARLVLLRRHEHDAAPGHRLGDDRPRQRASPRLDRIAAQRLDGRRAAAGRGAPRLRPLARGGVDVVVLGRGRRDEEEGGRERGEEVLRSHPADVRRSARYSYHQIEVG